MEINRKYSRSELKIKNLWDLWHGINVIND